MRKKTSNGKMLGVLVAVALFMGGMAFAAVPLYKMFCAATGYGGTPHILNKAWAASEGEVGRVVTVGFSANVFKDLPWEFAPEQPELTVKLGQVAMVNYRVRNKSDQPLTGTATFNVQPDKAGVYFNKIQCFCFTEQTLAPGEEKLLPVQFVIDPAMAEDKDYEDVSHITLSYTFFRQKAGAVNSAGKELE